jgi:hypothetical protein
MLSNNLPYWDGSTESMLTCQCQRKLEGMHRNQHPHTARKLYIRIENVIIGELSLVLSSVFIKDELSNIIPG